TYATSNRGQLPPLAGGLDLDALEPAMATATDQRYAPWTVHLLPYLDQTGLFERLQSPGLGTMTVDELASTVIETFTCPDNLNSESAGHLSFVANAGYDLADRWGANGTVTNLGHMY